MREAGRGERVLRTGDYFPIVFELFALGSHQGIGDDDAGLVLFSELGQFISGDDPGIRRGKRVLDFSFKTYEHVKVAAFLKFFNVVGGPVVPFFEAFDFDGG